LDKPLDVGKVRMKSTGATAKHTLALVVRKREKKIEWLDTLSQESEILFFEALLGAGVQDPLLDLAVKREQERQSEDDFANYVEDLVVKPGLKPEVREQAVQWFYSRIRIEKYEAQEKQAAAVVARVALQLYQEHPAQVDFTLSSERSEIRVKIFDLGRVQASLAS
jgi:hypothetical protein